VTKRHDKEEKHVLFDVQNVEEVETKEHQQRKLFRQRPVLASAVSGGSQITDFELNQIS
jgi:hypothetical protein